MGVGVGVIVWVGVGVIAWVRKGVWGLDSLDCCCKVCVCVCARLGRGGRGGGGVDVTWHSLRLLHTSLVKAPSNWL